jgi:hypothetical protein
MRKLTFFYGPSSSFEWDNCKSMYYNDRWDHVLLRITQCIIAKLSQVDGAAKDESLEDMKMICIDSYQ